MRMLELEKVNILLVDDRPENLVSLGAVLDSPDYNLVKASSGQEALKCLLERDFALILLDVQMPGMDGFETAKLIRLRGRSRDVPIIFVTAISTEEVFVFKGYSAGAVDYISKPFNPEILRSKVAVFSDLHRKKREIQKTAELQKEKDRLEREAGMARLELEILRRDQIANQRYKNLVEGIEHGIVWTADPQSLTPHFVSSRAELILGYPVSDWFSDPDFLITHIHPEDRDAVLDTFRRAQEGHKIGLDHRLVHANGNDIWVHTGIRLARRENGGLELHGLSYDINHLKKAESALKEAVRVRDEFLSIASHELSNPLLPLKLNVAMMRKSVAKGEMHKQDAILKLDDMLTVSDSQIDRLSRLINDLMDMARINHGKFVLKTEEFDLVALVKDILQRHAVVLQNSKCSLNLSVPDGMLIGKWDRLRIEQVVTNLLSNAVRYGAARPIDITVDSVGDRAVLQVGDHGVGIPAEAHQRIFERFERAVAPGQNGGLGLGLYIVSEILESHGGSIRVDSEVGKGTIFSVELPISVKTSAYVAS